MTAAPFTLEQLHEIMRELEQNAALLSEQEQAVVLWMRSKLDNNILIKLDEAQRVRDLYNRMVQREFSSF